VTGQLRIAVLAAAAVLLTGCERAPPDIPFDQKAWAAADVDTTMARYQMVRDLERKHPLVGMTKSEVVTLLGPPTPTDKWRAYDLIYVIGPNEIDFLWLLFKLDEHGRVSDYAVRTD
jgi:hypothetical protein